MATSYWIAHPAGRSFISAFSPEGVGQLLMFADHWTAGRYAIREHRHVPPPTTPDHRHCGYAEKGGDGIVWIEGADDLIGAGEAQRNFVRPERGRR